MSFSFSLSLYNSAFQIIGTNLFKKRTHFWNFGAPTVGRMHSYHPCLSMDSDKFFTLASVSRCPCPACWSLPLGEGPGWSGRCCTAAGFWCSQFLTCAALFPCSKNIACLSAKLSFKGKEFIWEKGLKTLTSEKAKAGRETHNY